MTFLEKIIKEKKEEIEGIKRQRPKEELMAQASDMKKRPFSKLFSQRFPQEVKIIAEVKRASPSMGVINNSFTHEELIRSYTEGGAYALSIITEKRYFNGEKGIIKQVRDLTGLPILRKDFIVDTYEIYESKALGADCVLLIAEAADKEFLKDCLYIAREVDLDCLLEVHSLYAFEKVADLDGFVLGINNRDLKTLKVDIHKGQHVLGSIPSNMPVIIESGIEKRQDIEEFIRKGASGFLIGTALMRSGDPKKKLEELRGVNGSEG